MRPSAPTSICRTALQPGKCIAQHATRRTFTTTRANRTVTEDADGKVWAGRYLPRDRTHGDPENPKNIAVIGGGITGLSTAHYLAKYASKGTTITLYEASDRLGGWLNTQHVGIEYNGAKSTVRFERGPRTLRSYAMDTWKMDDLVLYDLLRDIELEPIFRPGGTRYIAFGEKVVALTPKNLISHPKLRGIWMAALAAFWHLKRDRAGSFEDGLQLLEFLPHDKLDMPVGEFVRRVTHGSVAADQLASAIMHGVWGGDINTLSMRQAMPRLFWNFKFEDGPDQVHMPAHEATMVKAALADEGIRDMVRQSRQGQLLMFADGMGALPKAIEERLAANPAVEIKTETPIKKLEYDAAAGKVMVSAGGKPRAFDKVISTIYSKHLASLTPKLPSLDKTEAVTITAVNVWIPAPALNSPHRGLGYLLPRNDGGFNDSHGLLGVFFDSDALIRPKDEPEGTKLFLLFRGAIPEEEAIELSREILKTHLDIDPSIPAIALHRVNQDCIPQHSFQHKDLMNNADQELDNAFEGRLAVAGPSYSGTGVVGSIRAGHDVAAHVTGGHLDHIGPTGLAQFLQTARPNLVPVPRKDLVAIGRGISETVPWWLQMLR